MIGIAKASNPEIQEGGYRSRPYFLPVNCSNRRDEHEYEGAPSLMLVCLTTAGWSEYGYDACKYPT